jgi:probable HAF family extracellular repeat protein
VQPVAINEQGQVIGTSYTASNEQHAFIWTLADGIQDIGTLGGVYSIPVAINEQGQVVGYSYTASNEQHAFIWTSTYGIQDLGTLGGTYSRPIAINEQGQVLGSSYTASSDTVLTESHAVIWTIGLSPITPVEKIEAIIDDIRSLVQDGTLNDGQGNSLITKLETAERKLNEGNINAACNLLGKPFVNHVQAFINAGILSEIQGQQLIDAADNVVECE